MPFTCPQCGAGFDADERCQDRYLADQLEESQEPSFYVVHHLSVPCYMLQHNAYSQVGWVAARDLVQQFVYRGLTPEMARRQFQRQKGQRKTASITRGPKLPGVEAIRWSRTIAHVRVDTAEHYCADVREWAKSILVDSEALIPNR